MEQRAHRFEVRLARPDEAARVLAIEAAAAARFAGLGLIDEALGTSLAIDELVRLIDAGQVWVGCRDGIPVGMAIASACEGLAYLEEMDVVPEHGRRGLGTRLLERVCEWAREQGYVAVTLSTFATVPWNGPFYERHGFRALTQDQWAPWMRRVREKEAQHGLRVDARVFMRRELARTSGHPR